MLPPESQKGTSLEQLLAPHRVLWLRVSGSVGTGCLLTHSSALKTRKIEGFIRSIFCFGFGEAIMLLEYSQ